MRKIIVFLFMTLVLFASAQAYVPLTPAEAEKYLAEASHDQVIADIIKLDAIEHAVPEFEIGDLVIVHTKDGMMDVFFTGPIMINVAGELQYEINLPVWKKPEKDKGLDPWFFGTLAGVAGTGLFAILYLGK